MTKRKKEVMPTPISLLWRNILLISLYGDIDSHRANVLMETMLQKILESRSKAIILDILGVLTVDTSVANHILKITKASKLMGCDCVISGVSPSVAQSIVNLGIELRDVITVATLKDALEHVFDRLGFEVREIKEAPKKRAA